MCAGVPAYTKAAAVLYLNEPGSVRLSPSCNTGVTPLRHDEQEDAAVVAVWVVGAGLVASFIRPAAGIPSAVWLSACVVGVSSPGFCVEFFRPLSFVLLCVCFLLVAV